MIGFPLLHLGQGKVPQQEILEQELIWQGVKRSYYVYAPHQSGSRQNMPLLLALHGGNGSGKGFPHFLKGRFNELADQEGFIVVYPSGVKKGWNHGAAAPDWRKSTDDVGFLEQIVQTMHGQFSVDPSKIFITGISAGGWMTARMLCERPDLFAGAALVAATQFEESFLACHPATERSILVMNGTEDPILPYEGGAVLGNEDTRQQGSRLVGTQTFVEFWAQSNGCLPKAQVRQLPNSNWLDQTTITTYVYEGCQKGTQVMLYQINGGGHTWPGQVFMPGSKGILGNMSREINACDEIWAFFKSLNQE